MKAQVLSTDGKEVREIELSDQVFAGEVSDGAIYHALRNEEANKRIGTASTKTRGEVRGSGRKPWRQKGTGRARAGDRKSPLWTGGGTIFGPKPRSYRYALPRKLKRKAMTSILGLKVRDEVLTVIEDFAIESGRTKDLLTTIDKIAPRERTVMVLGDDDRMLKRAGRNVPWLTFLTYNRLRAHDLFYAKRLIVLESAALKLNDFYGPNSRSGGKEAA